MKLLANRLTIICVLFAFQTAAQYDGIKGQGIYKEYDKSYINPDTRGKHSVSLGGMASITSQTSEFTPSWAAHLGYNYLILKKRRRIFGIKEALRDEPRAGFGLHFTLLKEGQFYLMANFFDPFIGLKGKLFSLYLFNEYGIGIHRYTNVDDGSSQSALNLSLEVLRIRFGKSPLYLHLTANYATKNNFLGKDRLDLGAFGGLRYYIFKKK